jgi:hypothetical protein
MEIVSQPWTKSSTCNQLALTVVFSLTIYILFSSHFGENKIFLSLFLLSYNNGVAFFSSYISMWVTQCRKFYARKSIGWFFLKKNSWPINWMLQPFSFTIKKLRLMLFEITFQAMFYKNLFFYLKFIFYIFGSFWCVDIKFDF